MRKEASSGCGRDVGKEASSGCGRDVGKEAPSGCGRDVGRMHWFCDIMKKRNWDE